MSKRTLFALLALNFLIYACTSTKSLREQPPVGLKFGNNADKIDRPVPGPLILPESFNQAVETGTRTLTGHPGPNYWVQEAFYKLDGTLSPADTMLYGKAVIRYKNNSPYQMPAIFFELAQNLHSTEAVRAEPAEITGGMQINSIKMGNESVTYTMNPQQGVQAYGVQGTTMFVVLENALIPGESLDFEIDYQFKIPQSGASGRMGYSKDNLFFLGYWYPQVAVFDDIEGWFLDPFTGNAEFYHDFADFEVSIKAPSDWIIMGTGNFLNPEENLAPEILKRYENALTSDTVITIIGEQDFGKATNNSSEYLTWRFKAEKVTDVAYSAVKESIWDGTRAYLGGGGLNDEENYSRINAFWRPEAGNWTDNAVYAQHVISYLSKYTGVPYPWPHMTTVEGEDIIGGGMEYPMITIIGAYNDLPDVALYDVTAHELAHMWLPMLVSNNERRFAWMDEGATTYHEAKARWDYFDMDENLMQEFATFLQFSGTEYEGEIMRYSDYHYSGLAYNVATYPKPASLLFSLRGVLGSDLFEKAWKEYLNRWLYKHPTPYDFFHTFEDVAEQKLDWFWKSWYYETWELDQAIESVTISGNQLTIAITDLGNVPMPVDLTVTLSDGTRIEKRIGVDAWLLGKRQVEVILPITGEVLEVAIDKSALFPDINRENNIWKK